jgi:hypothetical protein
MTDDGVVTVVGLGAWCDYVTDNEYRERLVDEGWPTKEGEKLVQASKPGISFDVHEFADLADGRRVTLHEDRGFTTGVTIANNGPEPSDQWRSLTLEELEQGVRTTVLPDDDESQDEHPWEWLAELLHVHGVEATAEELRHLPYNVVFSERLRARVVNDG